MEFISTDIQQYAEQHTTPESDILKRISRDTHAKVLKPRMLSGHLQGQFLSMISAMIKPKLILEIGTYTGYSAICLAQGLQPGGKLITIDINEELEDQVREYFRIANLQSVVDYRIGNASQIIPTITEKIDLVFIDADKENYTRYFHLVIDQLNLNGFILADNVLWSGKVVEGKLDKDTKAIVDFNAKVHADTRVENVLLPIRDGLMLVRKIK